MVSLDFTFPAVVIFSWLGIVAGFILSKAAQEEVAHSKKAIIWLQRLIWAAVCFLLLKMLKFSAIESILVAAFFLLIIFFEYQIPIQIRHMVLGIGIMFASFDPAILALMGSIIFFFFALQAIRVLPRKENHFKILMRQLLQSSVYPLIALLLFVAHGLL